MTTIASRTELVRRVSERKAQIQALRAIAVGAAILYHYAPNQLPGGYVGVDVFFVVSGYLMTKTLVDIRRREGSAGVAANLRAFYLRRISRILPAALLTLLVSAVIILAATSQLSWYGNLKEILASALFVENWAAALNSTDYLRGGVGSVSQHFWSLSVEEQFYFVWPLIVFGLLWFRARRESRTGNRILLAGLGALTLASLAYSVYETTVHPDIAYFNTGARFWELSLGGVVYLIDRDFGLGRRVRAAAGWLGLAFIGYAVLTFNADTAFPGWIALIPVVGGGLVILTSAESAEWGPYRFLRLQPMQFIGDISYSMYLVHWPLLVLTMLAVTRGLSVGIGLRAVLLVLTVTLSWLMKRHVEDRFRITHIGAEISPRPQTPTSTARALRVVVAGLVLVLATAGAGYGFISRQVDHHFAALSEFREQDQTECADAIARGDAAHGCASAPANPMNTIPSPLIATRAEQYSDCQQAITRAGVITCRFGDPTRPILAVVGDSHMTQWLPAVLPWAEKHNYQVVTYLKGLCTLTDEAAIRSCSQWNDEVTARLAQKPPALIFTSALSAASDSLVESRASAVARKWRELMSDETRIVAFRDSPQPELTNVGNVPQCLVRTESYADCSFDLPAALASDVVGRAAEQTPGVSVIDLSDVLCPAQRCEPVLGPMLVYIDGQHISGTVGAALSEALGDRLETLGVR